MGTFDRTVRKRTAGLLRLENRKGGWWRIREQGLGRATLSKEATMHLRKIVEIRSDRQEANYICRNPGEIGGGLATDQLGQK